MEPSPFNAPEQRVEPDVVGRLQRSGDEEGCAECELEKGTCCERGDRPREVAGGVGVGGGRGALARVDDRDDVRLAGGDIHL